jgi:serine protease Do
MSHGDAHKRLEAEASRNLPPPYCEGNWRRSVSLLVVTALVILGVSVREHFQVRERKGWGQGGVGGPAVGGHAPAHGMGGRGTGQPAGGGMMVAKTAPQTAARQPASATGGDVKLTGAMDRTAFNGAARAIRPSVVGIRAAIGPAGGQQTLERIGSGLAVDSAGHIVTCQHVIAGATSIVVSRFGRPNERAHARVIAVEEDLALLQVVDGQAPAPALLADSSQVHVGDWILAVGHPFGLGLTVTAGIVGRKDGVLSIPGGRQYSGLLQTDAPINEGSSGGPLVDLNGKVVGLSTAIYAPTGVFSGAGFAIPSNRVRAFLSRNLGASFAPTPAPQVAAAGQASQPRWGLGLANLTQNVAAKLSYPRADGVLVESVVINSPADAAQFARGDIITAIAGQPVRDVGSVQWIQSRLGANQAVSVEIWRRGRSQTLTLRGNAYLPTG